MPKGGLSWKTVVDFKTEGSRALFQCEEQVKLKTSSFDEHGNELQRDQHRLLVHLLLQPHLTLVQD